MSEECFKVLKILQETVMEKGISSVALGCLVMVVFMLAAAGASLAVWV